MTFRLVLLASLTFAACSQPPATNNAADAPPTPLPCTVEAPTEEWRAAARTWCEGGVFTRVNVSTDDNNFTAVLHFSDQGAISYSSNRAALLDNFRRLADEVSMKTQLNVAFSLHDTAGAIVGACARARAAAGATCK